MELTYNELRKREVINVVDGKSFGHIVDVNLTFPTGELIGIFVPGRKVGGLFRIFDRSRLYIEEEKILKIGGDVILVEVKCGGACEKHVRLNKSSKPDKKPPYPPPCPPPCDAHYPPNCPPNQPPPCPPHHKNSGCAGTIDLSGICDESGRIDLDDY